VNDEPVAINIVVKLGSVWAHQQMFYPAGNTNLPGGCIA